MRMLWSAALGLAFGLAGCGTSPYACGNQSECTDGDVQGTCQPSGYCSFPDETCDSGQRYGKYAGGGFSGKCVLPQPGDTDTDTDSGTLPTSSVGSSGGSSSSGSSAEDTSSPSTTTEGTTSGCIPDCANRECGPDGCGATCAPGCGGNEACSPEGLCEGGCEPWRVQRGSQLRSIQLDADGNLLITGDDQGVGSVSQLSACNGDALAEASLPAAGTDDVRVMDAAPTPDGWAIVGQRVFEKGETREAFLAFLTPELDVQWEQTLAAPMEEGWGIRLVDDTWWTAGVADVTQEFARPWVFLSDANAEGCGFTTGAGLDGSGYNRALVVQGDFVYVGGSADGRGHLTIFEPSSCPDPSCDCAPFWSMEFDAAGSYTEIRGLSIVDDIVYAAGISGEEGASNDLQAFVARIDPPVPAVGQLWTFDPTPAFDGALQIHRHDDTLYVPLVTGFDSIDEDTAQAMLVALPIDLDATPQWETNLSGVGAAYDVVSDDAAVYVVGRDATNGWVLRCTTDGDCPD